MKQFNPVIFLLLALLQMPMSSFAHSTPEVVEITYNQVDISCHGANDGLIDLTVVEGVSPFTYAWSNGMTTEDLFDLAAGQYTVTVTDAEDMSATLSFSISEPSPLNIVVNITSPSCFGESDGSVEVIVTGGFPSYFYYWSTGYVGQFHPGLSAGTYFVDVVDSNGCLATETFVISESSPITISTIIEDASCGQGNGAITATVTGENGPYTYNWITGATTQTITALFPGDYTLTISDGLGCSAVESLTVGEKSIEGEVINITCDDNDTPTVPDDDVFYFVLLVTGGGPTGWTSGVGLSGNYDQPTTFGPFSIAAGPFNILLADNETPACNTTITITPPTGGCDEICEILPTINEYICDDNDTPGDPDDDVFYFTLSVTGSGNSDSWIANDLNNSTGQYNEITTLGPYPISGGVFGFDVIDAENPDCSVGIVVTPPVDCTCQLNPIEVTLTGDLMVPCEPGATTTVTASVSGGTSPYTYAWSPGYTDSQEELEAGTYSLTVTDANDCAVTTNFEIILDFDLVAEAGPDQVLTCSTPSVELDGSGSSVGPNVVYEWIGPTGTFTGQSVITVDQPGTYLLTLYEAGNDACSSSDFVIVTEDIISQLTINSNRISCDSALLNYTLGIGVGTPAWSYPDGSTSTNHVIGTTQSGYHVLSLVNEDNGCELTDSILVELDPSQCATITGRLVQDTIINCQPEAQEPGLSGWIMVIESDDDIFYAVTQADGTYSQSVPLGEYEVYPILISNLWESCEDFYPVSLTTAGATINQDLVVQELEPCPELMVEVTLPILRTCWERGIYIYYCNHGTDIADDAYINVTLDDYFTYLSATLPLTAQDGNQYTFAIGNVEVGECGSFYINVMTSCDAIVDQTLCVEAKIFPNDPCTPPDVNWSGSSLQLSSKCTPDEVLFTVKNVGEDMVGASNFIVIEDGVMLMVIPDTVLLEAGETFDYGLPANGSTYRMEVDQVDLHPGMSHPTAFIEGCGTNDQGAFSTGFINQFPMDDEDEFVDIDCREIVGSYDPNDKHGFPRGYGAEHYIKPGTGLEYLINFQNTGNDTAFLVVLRDTLSPYLDIRTLRPGASSHPYTWDIENGNVLVFTFENILLPDSTTNEAASHGHVEFKIDHLVDLPLETLIENSAAIYFDLNEPVITNTTWHRLGEDFIEVVPTATNAPEPKGTVQVFPNPMNHHTRFVLNHWLGNQYSFTLSDARGQTVFQDEFSQNVYNFPKGKLRTGVYFFQITSNRGGRAVGKLVIK